jgi:hypothetical protein
MKSYVIESDLMQARVIYYLEQWLFVADDIMVALGYTHKKWHHLPASELGEGWEDCLIDTALGKQYCYLLDHRAVSQLIIESPQDAVCKSEFERWYSDIRRLLEDEPPIKVPVDRKWELETVCASLHHQDESHVMDYLNFWRIQNEFAEREKQSEQESDTRMVINDPLKAERDLHQAAT